MVRCKAVSFWTPHLRSCKRRGPMCERSLTHRCKGLANLDSPVTGSSDVPGRPMSAKARPVLRPRCRSNTPSNTRSPWELFPGNFVLVGDGSVDLAQLWFCPDHAFKAVVSDGIGACGSIEQELYIYTATHMQVIARLATHDLVHSSGRTTVDTPAGE